MINAIWRKSFTPALVAATLTLAASAQAQQTVTPDNLVLREHLPTGEVQEYRHPVVEAGTKENTTRGKPLQSIERTAVNPRSGALIGADGQGSGVAVTDAKPSAARMTSPTIDSMTIDAHSQTYEPYLPVHFVRSPEVYTLSDGSTWNSGAGGFGSGRLLIDNVVTSGSVVRYEFVGFDDNMLFDYADYNSGDHSSAGRLDLTDGLTIEAEIGSTVATVNVRLTIVNNDPANYNDERFNYYSAIVDSVVPLSFTIENQTGTWQPDSFDSTLSYRTTQGVIDFANPISSPLQTELAVVGTSQLPPNVDVAFVALAEYDNGALRDVSADAEWSVSPQGIVELSQDGIVTTGDAPFDDEPVIVTATYEDFSATFNATVIGSATLLVPQDEWQTFQGNIAHTGNVGGATDPTDFNLRWQKTVADSELHQVAIADGKVFVTIPSRFTERTHVVALDLVDGDTLWTRSLGSPQSINPPAYAYGNVYVQSGQGINSQSPILHAFNAETGETVFESIFADQWSSFLAPTVVDGGVYINGGYYGGMYRFNAFSGDSQWFEDLPQYDGWTPSLVGNIAYGYVGGSFVALDRETGARLYTLQDPNWDWNGYDMRGALAIEDGRAVTVHNQRLIAFDISSPPGIDWDDLSGYVGQPALADGVVYAVRADQMVALSSADGSLLWAWSAPAGEDLSGPVVVTDTHAFLSSDSATYAIDLLSRDDTWSFAAAGQLSIAMDHLMIASPNGVLSAIAMPVILDSPIVSIDIVGPDSVAENTTEAYRAMVTYEDGRIRDRTVPATWYMKESDVASVDESGRLGVVQLFLPSQTVSLGARYAEGEVELETERQVTLYSLLNNSDFALRGLDAANMMKLSIVEQLLEAKRLELSARFALAGSTDADDIAALDELVQALQSGQAGIGSVEDSARALQRAIDYLAP